MDGHRGRDAKLALTLRALREQMWIGCITGFTCLAGANVVTDSLVNRLYGVITQRMLLRRLVYRVNGVLLEGMLCDSVKSWVRTVVQQTVAIARARVDRTVTLLNRMSPKVSRGPTLPAIIDIMLWHGQDNGKFGTLRDRMPSHQDVDRTSRAQFQLV